MVTSGIKRLQLIITVAFFPKNDRALFKRQLFTEYPLLIDRQHFPHALASCAGTFLGIVGKMGTGQFLHPLIAMRAILEHLEVIGGLFGLLPAIDRTDFLPASRAAPCAQLLEQHPEIGIDVRDRSHSRARIFIGNVLLDLDGGGHMANRLDIRFADPLVADRLQILALALLIKHIHRQSRFPGTGYPCKDNPFVPRQVHGDVFQIPFLRTDDPDMVHVCSPLPI
ncbi:hypothetical protein SDC9_114671 [bioreactor metagenome]|uniref:Uncharacterized protein n=1 Tax=bioreactor metagenome TaxID=1076179 RepID=A0A645BR92_9ZZZZ